MGRRFPDLCGIAAHAQDFMAPGLSCSTWQSRGTAGLWEALGLQGKGFPSRQCCKDPGCLLCRNTKQSGGGAAAPRMASTAAKWPPRASPPLEDSEVGPQQGAWQGQWGFQQGCCNLPSCRGRGAQATSLPGY